MKMLKSDFESFYRVEKFGQKTDVEDRSKD